MHEPRAPCAVHGRDDGGAATGAGDGRGCVTTAGGFVDGDGEAIGDCAMQHITFAGSFLQL